jgi:hypothetical protein
LAHGAVDRLAERIQQVVGSGFDAAAQSNGNRLVELKKAGKYGRFAVAPNGNRKRYSTITRND